jgi:hypothetical protein
MIGLVLRRLALNHNRSVSLYRHINRRSGWELVSYLGRHGELSSLEEGCSILPSARIVDVGNTWIGDRGCLGGTVRRDRCRPGKATRPVNLGLGMCQRPLRQSWLCKIVETADDSSSLELVLRNAARQAAPMKIISQAFRLSAAQQGQ